MNTIRVIKKVNVEKHAPKKINTINNNRNKNTTIIIITIMGDLQEGNYSDNEKLILLENSMIFTIISSGIYLLDDMFTLIISQH